MTVKRPLGSPLPRPPTGPHSAPSPSAVLQSQHCPRKQEITSALRTCPLRRTGERTNASLQLWITLNTPPDVVLAQDQPCRSARCLAKEQSLQTPCIVQAGWSRCKKICPMSMVFTVSPFSPLPHKEIYVRLRSARCAGRRLVGGHSRAAGSQACGEPARPMRSWLLSKHPAGSAALSGMFYNCRDC